MKTADAIKALRLFLSFACVILTPRIAVAEDPAGDDEWTTAARVYLAQVYPQWQNELDPAKKRDLADEAARAAVRAGKPDVVVDIATAGQFSAKQIPIPATVPDRLPLQELRTFEPPPRRPYGDDSYPWVIRRITRDRFELWQPLHGWLFDKTGRLLHEAKPPRRDGDGREWYGAFLRDGRWVTTDLWAYDCTLSFFSRTGSWRKEITSGEIVPPTSDDPAKRTLIGWARAGKEGQTFVVSVGEMGGHGIAQVPPEGSPRLLREDTAPWKLCYPRDLEPKGNYISLYVPSDDGAAILTRSEPGHGPYVGSPEYETGPFRARIPDGGTFGFWPASRAIYIIIEPSAADPPSSPSTWFYNPDGTFAGWIAACRIGDSAEPAAMLFRAPDNRLIVLEENYRISSVAEFTWPDGGRAAPRKLFPDLRLGFFDRGESLVLARW